MSLPPKHFLVWSKKELNTENHLSTFVIVGVVYTEIFMSFIKLHFSKQTFCFWGIFFEGGAYRSTGMKFVLDAALPAI